MPDKTLPEMRLPRMLLPAAVTVTLSLPLPRGRVPEALVPIKLPWTRLLLPLPVMKTPPRPLPEIGELSARSSTSETEISSENL